MRAVRFRPTDPRSYLGAAQAPIDVEGARRTSQRRARTATRTPPPQLLDGGEGEHLAVGELLERDVEFSLGVEVRVGVVSSL